MHNLQSEFYVILMYALPILLILLLIKMLIFKHIIREAVKEALEETNLSKRKTDETW